MAALETGIATTLTFLPPKGSKLTTKQNLFVHYYLEHRNALKAAQLAGYQGNYETLGQVGHENLKKPEIRGAIETYYKSRLLSSDGVLAELSDIAASPWKEHVEVKYGEGGEVIGAQLKLSDKIKSLELVGKFHKLFAEKVETEVTLSDSDIGRIGESLISSLMEAAQRRQLAEGKEVTPIEKVINVPKEAIRISME